MSHIEPALKATDRYGAIRELLDRLVHAGAVPPLGDSELFNAFKRREEMMSTSVGFGIAIPHVFSHSISEPLAAFGGSLGGVEFASLDNTPVEFVLLSVLPSSATAKGTSLKLLAQICRHLNPPQTRLALRSCSSTLEIKVVLDRFLEP